MLILATVLQAMALASPTPQVPAPDIVVNGRTTADARAALDDCLARRCRPDQDITATIALASEQFLDGDYDRSRGTLLRSRHRNARYAAAYPGAVANLNRALATMSRLDGRPLSARLATFDATAALKAPARPDTRAVLLQRLETGNQLGFESKLEEAVRLYDGVARDARRAGLTDVEARAMFEAAVLYSAAAEVDFQYRGAAARRTAILADRREPVFGAYRDGLALLRVKLASLAVGFKDRGGVVAASTPTLPRVDRAILLSEPLPKFVGSTSGLSGSTSDRPEWADVAFWVRPDGSVAGPKLVAQSDPAPGPWIGVKLDAVRGRRYAPLDRPAADAGVYVVERYSMVHDIQSKTGSALKQRTVAGTLVTTDITSAHPEPDTMM